MTPAYGGTVQDLFGSIDQTTVVLQAGTRQDRFEAGIDLNVSTLLTNAGIQVRSWDSGNSGPGSGSGRTDIALYAGVGLANVLQMQAAYGSQTGFGIRIRSDIPLTPTPGSWRDFNKGTYWVITPFIETTLTHDRGALFGIGAGRTF